MRLCFFRVHKELRIWILEKTSLLNPSFVNETNNVLNEDNKVDDLMTRYFATRYLL